MKWTREPCFLSRAKCCTHSHPAQACTCHASASTHLHNTRDQGPFTSLQRVHPDQNLLSCFRFFIRGESAETFVPRLWDRTRCCFDQRGSSDRSEGETWPLVSGHRAAGPTLARQVECNGLLAQTIRRGPTHERSCTAGVWAPSLHRKSQAPTECRFSRVSRCPHLGSGSLERDGCYSTGTIPAAPPTGAGLITSVQGLLRKPEPSQLCDGPECHGKNENLNCQTEQK